MNRRKFIILAGTGTTMLIIPPSLYYIAPEVRQYAVKLIEKELWYLKLESGSVMKYANDYIAATGNNTVSALKWKMLYYLRFNAENSERINDLVKYFLLSTDFFINKMDENRKVHYLGLYSPYHSPVPNPYSFVLHPADEIADPL